MPYFSVIIPVYNVALYLRECLDSVRAQTFTDWEAICVDDGSTDDSGAILDEYAAKDNRFRIVHKKNEGVCVSRNVALEVATGKYLVFVDADDVILSDWLRVFHDVIVKDGCDVVRARLRYWHGDSEYKNVAEPTYSIVARYTSHKAVCEWGVAEVLESGYSVLNCVRRDKIVGVKFPNGVRILEDCIFSAYVMAHADSVSVIDFKGYLYRMRENSAVHKHGSRQSIVLDLYNVFNALSDFWNYYRRNMNGCTAIAEVRRGIASFVFRNTMMLGIANRRCLATPNADFRKLAESVRVLYCTGAFAMSALTIFERAMLLLYAKTSCWGGLLLLWKVRAGKDKLSKLVGK